MTLNPPGIHSDNRLFEWVSAIALINVGLILFFWPDSIAVGNYNILLTVVGSRELMLFYLTIGLTRSVVLYKNGHLGTWGPHLRAIMCGFGMVAWAQFGFALWLKLSEPSTTLGILAALIMGELRSVLRSRHDADGT